jgi:hypothetical protein
LVAHSFSSSRSGTVPDAPSVAPSRRQSAVQPDPETWCLDPSQGDDIRLVEWARQAAWLGSVLWASAGWLGDILSPEGWLAVGMPPAGAHVVA